MFDDLFDFILPFILALALLGGCLLALSIDKDTLYNVTVYHLDGTVESFVSVEKPTSLYSFKLKDGSFYDLPDGVKYKYEIVEKSDKGLNIKKDKE